MATSEPAPVHGLEEPDVLARNLGAGARLWSAALAFAFIAFLFAFVYLKSLDSNGQWSGPPGADVSPPVGFGIAILACVVLCTAAFGAAGRALEQDSPRRWNGLALLALALELAAVVLLVWQFAAIGFGPSSGGYASVFIGWTAFLGLNLIGGVYWLETIVAQSLSSHDQRPVGHHTEITNASSLLVPEASAFAFYNSFLAAATAVTFVMLYVVR